MQDFTFKWDADAQRLEVAEFGVVRVHLVAGLYATS